MLTIRLQRVGKKNQPVFRIVLAEKHRAAKKKIQEMLGHYNPRTKEFGVRDEARLKYWLQEHIEVSPTVHNLFVDRGFISGQKVKAWKPKRKAQEATPTLTPETPAATPEAPATEAVAKSPAEKPAES